MKLLILDTFRRFIPYRIHLLFVFLVIIVVANVFAVLHFPAHFLGGARTPDTALGYTGQEILDWYEVIGPNGRRLYLAGAFFLDILLIIPSYVLLFGSHLVAKNCNVRWLFLPILTGIFDIVETSTHSLNCYIYDTEKVGTGTLSIFWLRRTSIVTVMKYMMWNICFAMCVYHSAVDKSDQKFKSS